MKNSSMLDFKASQKKMHARTHTHTHTPIGNIHFTVKQDSHLETGVIYVVLFAGDSDRSMT